MDRWTIIFTPDGPTFAVEGHDVQAFPEFDRIEVVDMDTLRAALVLLETAKPDYTDPHLRRSWAQRLRALRARVGA
jgi:hypothetical protein